MIRGMEKRVKCSDRRRLVALVIVFSVTATACFPNASNQVSDPPEATADLPVEPPAEEAAPPEPEPAASDEPFPEPQPEASSPTAESYTSAGDSTSAPATTGAINVSSFTTEELFATGEGGCGMSLWRADSDPFQDGFIFFNGLDELAIIPIGGEMVRLERKTATG
ncbi:MAG: hypothetical protein AAF289_20620, partial [Cyanobacteria bacterium P01_A01_bin.135]